MNEKFLFAIKVGFASVFLLFLAAVVLFGYFGSAKPRVFSVGAAEGSPEVDALTTRIDLLEERITSLEEGVKMIEQALTE